MRVRNDGPDRVMFGLHFAEGAVVKLPEGLEASKVAAIVREFTVVQEDATPAPVVQPPPTATRPPAVQPDFDDTVIVKTPRRTGRRY